MDFPEAWHITRTPNHWYNEQTMKEYLNRIIVPYINRKKKELELPEMQPALVIFDEFNGQTTDEVLKLLVDNNIFYVIVPPNTTDKLQPMDLSVNKATKEFLRSQFQAWYSEKISVQTTTSVSHITPVDLKLSIMMPIGAKWMVQLFDYFQARPEIISNGFSAAGITECLQD